MAEKRQPQRYARLIEAAERLSAPEVHILEIGTYRGTRAEAMIRAAALHRAPDAIHYYGFDLFGPTPRDEHTARTVPPALSTIRKLLTATGARIWLCAGDSRVTLPAAIPDLPFMDLIFIDGGHSDETVASDWSACQTLMRPDTVVIFDDFWNLGSGGCNGTINTLDPRFAAAMLDPADEFPRPWGVLRTQLVQVTLRDWRGAGCS